MGIIWISLCTFAFSKAKVGLDWQRQQQRHPARLCCLNSDLVEGFEGDHKTNEETIKKKKDIIEIEMPKKRGAKKQQQHSSDDKKTKLRTSQDVLDRLKWDSGTGYSPDTVLVGYEDRIMGPMEKPVADFLGLDEGGDIPEHRIYYFRQATESVAPRAMDFLWDRTARMDKLFGSGEGANQPLAPETLAAAQKAHATMIRLEQEHAQNREVQEHNQQARHVRRQLAAQVLEAHQQADNEQQQQQAQTETISTVRQQLEAQEISGENGNDNSNEMELDGGADSSTTTSRKRPLPSSPPTTPTPIALEDVDRIRLEAIFHPKFENENERDQQIRTSMKEKVAAGEGYLEVSLKHSGSLLLWSGAQRYYSKNSMDNEFTHVGEVLLRQHFCRAYWNDGDDTTHKAALSETHYQECSDFVESQRLTLAFEVVTAVLGDHGDRPKRDFLILTAVADRSEERFYTTAEVMELAQRFRLPHNDVWTFSSTDSVSALFRFYDTSRETSLATFVDETLTKAAETRVRSLYPHTDFQGEILEGIVIRYVPDKTSGGSKESSSERMAAVAKVADELHTNQVPSSLPDCHDLVATVKQGDSSPCLSVDVRSLFAQKRSGKGDKSFSTAVEKLLGSSNQNRRTGKRLTKGQAGGVPALLRKLRDSDDEETKRIATLVQALNKLNVRVNYHVIREELTDIGFSRWLCIVHVLLDFAHQKYRNKMQPGDMALFRGFALELSSSTNSFSANNRAHATTKIDSNETGSDSEAGLMLKMKLLPYMVRTFGCRNGLGKIKQAGVPGFVQYTSNLFSKWRMSANARKTWMPFFQAWAEYAAPRLQKRLPEDGDMPQLSSDNYLEHLQKFIPLYEAGQFQSAAEFGGFCVVVAPDEATADHAADLMAKRVGCKNRYSSQNLPNGLTNGVVCGVGADDRMGRFHNLLADRKDDSSVVFVGCSDEDVASVVGAQQAKNLSGRLKGWRKLKAPFMVDLPLNSIPREDAMDTDDAASKEAQKAFDAVVEKLRESVIATEEALAAAGLMIFFPQIPGCGKSSLVDELAEQELKGFLSERKDPERALAIRMGDKTKGKFWPLVKKEKTENPSSVYIADKNVPAVSWDLIASVCGESSAIGVPVIPQNALQTTVVEGIRWPKDGQVTMGRTHTFPFTLEYLAVCMLRVSLRPPNSHPGKLDSSLDRACMIVVMFFCLYQGVAADEYLELMATKFSSNSAMLASEPIEVPFLRSSEPQLPNELKDLLIEAIRAQCGLNTKRMDVGKVKDKYLDGLEARLRSSLAENKSLLNSMTSTIEESKQSFLQQIKQAVKRADDSGDDSFVESGEHSEQEDGKPRALGSSKKIQFVSIDVSSDDIHNFLLEHVDKPQYEGFWHIAAGKKPAKDIFLGTKLTDKRLTRQTHVTMAHQRDHSQEELRAEFGSLEGQSVDVKATALLWDDKTAALEVQLPSTTKDGSTLPPSKNEFVHVTLWCQRGTQAFRSNELPGLVEKGKATRVEFEDARSLSGKLTL